MIEQLSALTSEPAQKNRIMTRILLVDTDEACRAHIRKHVQSRPAAYELVGEASSMVTAIRLIAQLRPDVVFLALALSEQVGLHLSNLVRELYPDTRLVILADGPQYAIQALRNSVMGYLVKPLKEEAIASVLARVEQQQQSPMRGHLDAEKQLPERLLLPNSTGMEMLITQDILYLEAEGPYTHFHLEDGSRRIICKSIGHFEYLLDYDAFFRSHRSYIVHLQAVKKYLHAAGGQLLLKNDVRIPLSKSQKKAFLQRIHW